MKETKILEGGAKSWPKTRVTFGRGPDVMAGAGTGHRHARISHWEGAHATSCSGPVGDSVFFPKYYSLGQGRSTSFAA
jgi:hypothetical protein